MQILLQFIIIILYGFIFSFSEEIISTWENGEKKTVLFYNSKKILSKEKNFKNNKKHGKYIDYYSPKIPNNNDSLYQLYIENPKEYPVQPRKIAYYNNDILDSLIEFSQSGEIRLKGDYVRGKKDGYWIENGGLMEGNYINGKKEDEWIWYFSNKKQHRRKSNYKDGELHGEFILYDVSDGIDEKGIYENGKKVGFWIESEYGSNDFSQGNYLDGKKQDEWKIYSKDRYRDTQYLKSKSNYKDDKLDGQYIEYKIINLKNGKDNETIVQGNYKDGNKIGFWIEKNSEGNYNQDKKNGEWITYQFKNGQKNISKKEFYITKILDWYPPSHHSRRNGREGPQSFESILINEKIYYSDGVLREEAIFGLSDSITKHGGHGNGSGASELKTEYYENGNIKKEESYKRGPIYGYNRYGGTKHGIWREYCVDGNISSEKNYKDRKVVGYFYDTKHTGCSLYRGSNIIFLNNTNIAEEPIDNSIQKIEGNAKKNFLLMKDTAFKSAYYNKPTHFRSSIYEGFNDQDGNPKEIINYIDSTLTYKRIVNELDSTKNSDNLFEYKFFINNQIIEEGIISNPRMNPEEIYVSADKKYLWKEYAKDGGILIETIDDDDKLKTKIFYNDKGLEIGRLNGKHNSELDGTFIKYYRNFDYHRSKSHNLKHIVGKYKDGKQIGEWINYAYELINPDEVSLNKQILNPNSRKIVLKANLDEKIRNGDWILSYGDFISERLLWYKGINGYKAMTNTQALRSASTGKLKGISRGDYDKDRHSHWSWKPSYMDEGNRIKNYIILSGKYKNDMQEGLWKAIKFPGDTILEEATYRDGNLDGKMIHYYENGNKNFEGNYLQGERIGEWIYYYENGNIKAKGEIQDGKPSGNWAIYNKDGTLQKDEEKWRFFK